MREVPKQRDLTASEKAQVLRGLSFGRARYEDAPELDLRKEHFHEELNRKETGISLGQIRSLGAHISIKVEKVLKDSCANLDGNSRKAVRNLKPDDLVCIHFYWRSARSASERDEKIERFSKLFQVPVTVLKVVVQKYEDSIANLLDGEAESEAEVTDGSESSELEWRRQQVQIVKEGAAGRASGDKVFYGFPNKQIYRSAALRFFQARATPAEIHNGFALCFPSEDGDAELALFHELGVPFEHIFGAEGGNRRARWRVKTRAADLGYHPLIGRLENILPIETPFTFVHLDLCGQFAEDKLRILRNIKLAPQAYVIVNLRVGREQKWVQNLLKEQGRIAEHNEIADRDYLKLFDKFRGKREINQRELAEIMRHSERGLKPALSTGRSANGNHDLLSENRDRYLEGLVLANISASLLPDRWEFAQRTRNALESESISKEGEFEFHAFSKGYSQQIAELTRNGILRLPSCSKRVLDETGGATLLSSHWLADLVRYCGLGKPKVAHLEKYSYRSQATRTGAKDAGGRSVFYTSMAELHSPIEIFPRVRQLATFSFNCVAHMVANEIRKKNPTYGYYLTSKRGTPIMSGIRLQSSDNVGFASDDIPQEQVSARHFIDQWTLYTLWALKYPLVNSYEQARIIRQKLEA